MHEVYTYTYPYADEMEGLCVIRDDQEGGGREDTLAATDMLFLFHFSSFATLLHLSQCRVNLEVAWNHRRTYR
jgi:hypothetical protein